MKKPVVIIIFNRPDLIDAVIRPVRNYAPNRVYLIADGPRPSRTGEAQLCAEARAVALGAIDWPCKLELVFSETNLGCRNRVVSGLDHVFQRETEAVILEDDTVANDDFLPYCERMLDAYRDDEGIFSITGTKLFSGLGQQTSAFPSNFTHIWGWATWRRSWLKYDRDLGCLSTGALRMEMQRFLSARHIRHWERVLTDVQSGRINTWDYQWQASAWMAHACCLTPPRNLVTNLGFRSDATHNSKPGLFSEMKTYPLTDFPVALRKKSPTYEWLFQNMFHNPSRPLRWIRSLWVWAGARRKASAPPQVTSPGIPPNSPHESGFTNENRPA